MGNCCKIRMLRQRKNELSPFLPLPLSWGVAEFVAASVDIAIRFSPDIASGNSIAMGPANDDVKKSATAAGKSPNGAIYTACVATTDCRARRDDACSPALLISECARPMPYGRILMRS